MAVTITKNLFTKLKTLQTTLREKQELRKSDAVENAKAASRDHVAEKAIQTKLLETGENGKVAEIEHATKIEIKIESVQSKIENQTVAEDTNSIKQLGEYAKLAVEIEGAYNRFVEIATQAGSALEGLKQAEATCIAKYGNHGLLSVEGVACVEAATAHFDTYNDLVGNINILNQNAAIIDANL